MPIISILPVPGAVPGTGWVLQSHLLNPFIYPLSHLPIHIYPFIQPTIQPAICSLSINVPIHPPSTHPVHPASHLLTTHLPTPPSFYPLSTHPSIHSPTHPSIHLPIHAPIHLFITLFTDPSTHLLIHSLIRYSLKSTMCLA